MPHLRVIAKQATLAVISHTPHYRLSSQRFAGWGATVRELDYLAGLFARVIHVAPLHDGMVPPSCIPYQRDNISIVPLQSSGGTTLLAKCQILKRAPANTQAILRALEDADVFQFRAPTGIGVYLLPFLTWFVDKPHWVKYAGDWRDPSVPWSYRFQRWWLKKDFLRCPVTINGRWPNQPEHVLAFENPCLSEQEYTQGAKSGATKDFSQPLQFLFVGALNQAKGVHLILEAFSRITPHPRIERLVLVGDGAERDTFVNAAKRIHCNVEFAGFLSSEQVMARYSESHVLLLPSRTEGFAKVIAEAANFGCIPAVSAVSAIPQYVNDQNGFLLRNVTGQGVQHVVERIVESSPHDLQEQSRRARDMADSFRFEAFGKALLSEVFSRLDIPHAAAS